MVKPKTPRAKSLPRSKDAEALDRAHDALLDAAEVYASCVDFGEAGHPGVSSRLTSAAIAWRNAQRKALGVVK